MRLYFAILLVAVMPAAVFSRQITIKPDSVKAGKQLSLAKNYTLQQFISFYMEFGKVHTDLKYGTTSVNEMYKDEQFTYFIRGTDKYAVNFIKVLSSELAKTDYTLLDGDTIRKKFIAEIVPEKDKQKGNADNKCMMAYENATFNYRYIESSNQLEVQYHWKVKCELVSTLINKTYTAKYNISTQSFEAK